MRRENLPELNQISGFAVFIFLLFLFGLFVELSVKAGETSLNGLSRIAALLTKPVFAAVLLVMFAFYQRQVQTRIITAADRLKQTADTAKKTVEQVQSAVNSVNTTVNTFTGLVGMFQLPLPNNLLLPPQPPSTLTTQLMREELRELALEELAKELLCQPSGTGA